MPNACCMKNCTSNSKTDKLRSFYALPMDINRCLAWLKACGRPELANHSVEYHYRTSRVCDLHFKPSDRRKKTLIPNAVPLPYDQTPVKNKPTHTEGTVVVGYTDFDTDIELPGTSTTANTSHEQMGINKKNRLKRSQEKLTALQESKTDLFKLINLQANLEKPNIDKQCAKKLQMFALKLYISCPLTYTIVRSALRLPSEKILRRIDLGIDGSMNYNVTTNLLTKINPLSESDQFCTVCLKKVPLKRFLFYHINRDKVIGFRNIDGEERLEAATHVYLLMARGLNAKWEQLVAYCFTDESDDLSSIHPWLNSVLRILRTIGCKIVALVVDHKDFYDYFKNHIRSFTQPIIRADNEIDQLYCIFDLPQLIISLRNLLMTHELQFQDDDGSLVIADWKTIETVYSKNSSNKVKPLVSKLTKSHVYPNESEKKELKYAVEVFSKSVSEALDGERKTCVDNDNRIRGTQKLAALVNDVFDILNSSTHSHRNKYKNAFTGEPHQMRAIRKFMEFLTNVKPLDVLDSIAFNCIYGLRISIMSFSIILRDLLPKGIKSLVTHRFNLDAANNFFDFVTQKSKSIQPTAVEFHKCFRQKFILQLMKPCKTSNSTDNMQKFLQVLDVRQMSQHKMMSDDFKKTLEVQTVDYRFEVPTVDSFHYICWYLLKKCYQAHDQGPCDGFTIALINNNQDIRWKQYTWDSYFKPPEKFVDLIKQLDQKFNECFGHKLEVGLGTGILLSMRELKHLLMCPCFPISYLRRIFVRLRIFNIIRYNNRRLGDEHFRFSSTDFYNIDAM